MAYLHCHTKGCGFAQDDFWSWGYNPVKTFCSYVRHFKLWSPHTLKGDAPTFPQHSWVFLWHEFKRMLRVVRLIVPSKKYPWPTNSKWKAAVLKAGRWPACPKCGKNQLDID